MTATTTKTGQRLEGRAVPEGNHQIVATDFDSFYRTSRDNVARALAVTLGNSELAAEATDEARARAYARWSTISRYDRPAGWVYRVGLNWSRTALVRRRKHDELVKTIAVRPQVEEAPAVFDPELADALDDLPTSQRAVVVCRFLLDMTTEETATALRIRPGTVKSRLHRALDRLRSVVLEGTEPT